jgi:dipeptidyl aminopeptidase/acylaminoacyl peptidase
MRWSTGFFGLDEPETVMRNLPLRHSFVAAILLFACGGTPAETTAPKARIVESRDCFAAGAHDPSAARVPREILAGYQRTIECAFFVYETNGVVVSGFSARPAGSRAARLPAVIYNRGGNGELGRVNLALMTLQVMPLASRGFFVIGSQYREQDEFGGSDVDDVLALLDLIDARADIAGDRVGMMGFSRGGIETVIAATRSDRFEAIALLGTPSDLLEDLEYRPDMERVYERRIPNYSSGREEALRARSPLHLVERLPAGLPILILHGGKDERARPANASRLASRLLELGREHKLVIYPDGDHAMSGHGAELREEVARWFETYLVDPREH